MSSTEPPSKTNRHNDAHTKAAQDALISKGRVEKVREVDPDEQARQRKKFQMMMGDEDRMEGGVSGPEGAPSPFDLFSTTTTGSEGTSSKMVGDVAESPTPRSSYGDVQDAVVASPNYSPPPTLYDAPQTDSEDEATTGALPRSERFWSNADAPPDQPLKPQQYQETERSAARTMGQKKKGKGEVLPMGVEKKKKEEYASFGPPGKPIHTKTSQPKDTKQGLPSPFEEAAKTASVRKDKEREREAVPTRYFAAEEIEKTKKKHREKEKAEQPFATREPDVVPFRFDEQEKGGGGHRGREQKIVEIEAPSLPLLSSHVQPMAFAAASEATPYLSSQTVSLYFQMVGQIYVMVEPPGISVTQVVLNNPAYAHSKFYGATITIEKYASAPDSFNIRLTGNDAAVASFRENIPGLMTAFQNSSLPFRVNRVEAEYTIERPVFRRKEWGEKEKDAGGGDLGERRK
jgi:hypothetical protein